MKPLDKEGSIRLSKSIEAERGECWSNSIKAALLDPGLTYVEGWIVGDKDYLVIEHGWIENKTSILDPTLAISRSYGVAYYPAAYYSREELALEILKDDISLPLIYQREEYQDKYKIARDQAFSLSEEYHNTGMP